jgi:hypothetical protein
LRRAAAAEYPADGAFAVEHVPIIRVARSGAVIARAAKLQRHGSIQVAVCASIAAMARKAKPLTDQAVEQADYRTWKRRAAALLEGQGISASAIPEKTWRVLYVNRQATPEKAAEEARVHYENFIRRPSLALRKRG